MGATEGDVIDPARVPADVVRRYLGDRVDLDHPVAEATTYRVGGRASYHFVAESIEDLVRVAGLCRDTGLMAVVIGRGSNVLFSDDGFQGLVVHLGDFAARVVIPGIEIVPVGSPVEVRLGAAVPLPVAARQLASAGLSGFEWAVGVPGTVGGAIRMNAGGHGSDMAHSLRSAEVFDFRRSSVRTMKTAELQLRFRGSGLTDDDVVLGVVIEVRRGTAEESMALIDEIVRWRRSNQPGGQNAGSVFVNPVPGEVSAGELVDRCGLRGFRIGTASVSDKHANFIQADPQGRAADVVAVMKHVRRTVLAKTGFALRSEIRLVGFDAESIAELEGDGGESAASGLHPGGRP